MGHLRDPPVGGLLTMLIVLKTTDLLSASEADRPVDPIVTSGFAELDSLTGEWLRAAPGWCWEFRVRAERRF